MKKFIVDENTIIEDILNNVKDAEPILLGFGMHCLYCPHSIRETIKEACEVHDIDVNLVLQKLNEER